jgi:hypothetical protein
LGTSFYIFVVFPSPFDLHRKKKKKKKKRLLLQLHHTFTPNSKIGTIVSDLPCNIGGNAGFNWRVPATLPWTVAASDDVYVRLYKTTDPSENSEHLWTKPATFNIVGCPSTSVCPTASPTPAPTPFPTPLPPTPLPTDSTSATPTNRTTTATNTTTTTATGSTSSGGSSSGGTSSPMESTQSGSMSGSGGNSSSASWTTLVVDPNSQSSATGNATVLLDACLRWSDCVACHQQTQCYWCGDDSADFFGCRSIGLGGGFLGPSDAATHIVPNLFANDGSTCQNWYYGQCAITGRALVFLVAGAIALVLVSGCVVTHCVLLLLQRQVLQRWCIVKERSRSRAVAVVDGRRRCRADRWWTMMIVCERRQALARG